MTALYSILHFLVDGVCALAMFGYFATRENWYVNILLYNFCAFAMQMPLGVVLDGLCGKQSVRKTFPTYFYAVAGVVLTLVGAFIHPIVLGIGNALFHLGGGVATIQEDEAKGLNGRGLGVFVAPGALGLYIGTLLGKSGDMPIRNIIISVGVVMLLCLLYVEKRYVRRAENVIRESASLLPSINLGKSSTLWLASGCLFVVILRSYIGMAVNFPWKSTVFAGTIAVLAVALGKVSGGFAAATFGIRRTIILSLGAAAVCYLLSGNIVAGVIALFLFNMTMPITLYLLIQRLKEMPGFAFGLLTFGLFLGWMPTYLELYLPMDGQTMGCLGSLISLVILWFCADDGKEGKVPFAESTNKETQEAG